MMNRSIRATAFAAYNTCPYKYKMLADNDYNNDNFDVGIAVHDTLQYVPECLLSGKDWKPILIEKIGGMDRCTPAMLDKCIQTIKPGVRNIEETLLQGYDIKTEVSMQRDLECGITITGRADRIDIKDDIFRIVDYKTSFFAPTQQDMMGNFQLLIYSFLSQAMATAKQRVEICIFSLGKDVFQNIEVPLEVEQIVGDVLNARALKMLKDEEDDNLKPTPSSACSYCELKYKCRFWEEYKQFFEIPESLEDKVALLELLLNYNKGIESTIDSLKDDIVAEMISKGLDEIEIEGKERYIMQRIVYKDNKVSISKPFIKVR